MKTFGFIGLGLMGGSLAKAVRRFSRTAANNKAASCKAPLCETVPTAVRANRIFACDANEDVLNKALAEKVIDKAFTPPGADKMLSACDIVFICLYPKASADFLLRHENAFKSGAVVTDISGVKKEAAKRFSGFTRKDIFFVSGHPMAGSEKEGYEHSSADICLGRNYILIENAATDASSIALLSDIIRAMGFKRIIRTDEETHDRKIAFTSQLCHVIASALVDSAEDSAITAFGGGSYEDLTRIAMINAPLWTQLFFENRENLLAHIRRFEQSLENIRALLEGGKTDELCNVLEAVRKKRIAMSSLK